MADIAPSPIGPWTRHEPLGQGGNATVWRATREGLDRPVALKVIDSRKVDEESYVRFVREVEVLRGHGSGPGILRVLDAHLPADPSKADRAWLSMPVATPITDALAGRPLADVVSAVASIATTLARLKADSGIAHRDIKPGNLYELGGEFLVGDFGLVSIPGADSITGNGRQVGPAHFTAYEMIASPSSADPHPADVYSLGKTLWVLATGQRFPPEGHQPATTPQFSIADMCPHPRSYLLDQAIDRMTRLRPEERPTMEEVARDLTDWSSLATEVPTLDVSDVRSRMLAKIARAMDEQNTVGEQKEMAIVAVRRLQELTAPINEELKRLHPRTDVDSMSDQMTANVLKGHHPGHRVAWEWRRCTIVAPIDGPMATALKVSRAVELLDDGTLYLYMMVFVGRQGTMGSNYHWGLNPTPSAPVGTVEAERMLDDAVAQLAIAVRQGAEVLVEQLPDLSGTG